MSVRRSVNGSCFEALVSFLAVGEGDDLVPGLAEGALKKAAHRVVVLGEKNSIHGYSKRIGGHDAMDPTLDVIFEDGR